MMRRKPVYIYDRADWPAFRWDSDNIAAQLAAVRHHQGRLLGQMESLGFNLRMETTLLTLTQDALKTSEIEGERLDRDQVRSSLARRLGLETAGVLATDKQAEAIAAVVVDATQHFDQALTAERLFRWHRMLFPTGEAGLDPITVGAWRTDASGPMQVVSGRPGRQQIHFEGPPADRVPAEMARFLVWFEDRTEKTDPVLRAAIARNVAGDPDAAPILSAAETAAAIARSVRKRLGISQAEFAARYHVPIGTLRDWEQNRKQPDAPALAYLRVIAREPDMVARALRREAA